MIETINEGCAGVEIFIGFIGYRDFSDLDFGENYINLELTNEFQIFHFKFKFINYIFLNEN